MSAPEWKPFCTDVADGAQEAKHGNRRAILTPPRVSITGRLWHWAAIDCGTERVIREGSATTEEAAKIAAGIAIGAMRRPGGGRPG